MQTWSFEKPKSLIKLFVNPLILNEVALTWTHSTKTIHHERPEHRRADPQHLQRHSGLPREELEPLRSFARPAGDTWRHWQRSQIRFPRRHFPYEMLYQHPTSFAAPLGCVFYDSNVVFQVWPRTEKPFSSTVVPLLLPLFAFVPVPVAAYSPFKFIIVLSFCPSVILAVESRVPLASVNFKCSGCTRKVQRFLILFTNIPRTK